MRPPATGRSVSSSASTELLALGYAGDAIRRRAGATALLDEVGDDVTASRRLRLVLRRRGRPRRRRRAGRARFARALELAEQTDASFVTGIAGASKASIDARVGDPTVAAAEYRRLITHWRRAGMWSTQWTMLRSIAGLLARLGRTATPPCWRERCGRPRPGTASSAPTRSRSASWARSCATRWATRPTRRRCAEGAVLDGDAAVEHALRAL